MRKALLFVGALSLLVFVAQAKALTIGFEGVITVNAPTLDPDSTQFDDRLAVGNAVWGSYEIKDGLKDFRPNDPDFGFFLSPFIFFIEDTEFGTSAFETNSSNLRIQNNLTDAQTGSLYDLYDLSDSAASGLGGSTQGGANPIAPNNFIITLTDLDASIFSSGVLPLSVPDIINDYEEAEFTVFFGAGRINGTITSMFEINDEPNSVPEPATFFLLGSSLVGLAGFGRKKFKK